MRIAVYGLVLTGIAQPGGGLDSCQLACVKPKLNIVTPSGVPISHSGASPVVAMTSIRQYAQKAPVRRLVASGAISPKIEILKFEHPAISNQDVIGGDDDGNDRFQSATGSSLTGSVVAEAIRIDAKIAFDPRSAGKAKSPQQLAQDAWDARQRLAYVDPIMPPEFAYAEVQETASGELRVVTALVGSHSQEAGSDAQPNANQSQEIQNNKSQASSVPIAEHQMELIPK